MKQANGPRVSDVFRAGLRSCSHEWISRDKQKIIDAILACRTSALGGHISECGRCGRREQSYNSCWNRHCPSCQGGKAFQWVSERAQELLPVPYYHVVFTLPSEVRNLCYRNKKIVYDCMFQAASESMQEAASRKHQVQLGFFGILHTWNQELQYHPHNHFVVPAGGLTREGEWRNFPSASKFFLPVRVLSKLFKGKFIWHLKNAYRNNLLYLENELSPLQNPKDFEHLISKAASQDWVVYAKRPFGGPGQVLKYLASYTHRVGISERRIVALTNGDVSFSARSRGEKQKKKIVTIPAHLFIRRFLLHTLPKGFRRIRYFGFLVNHIRAKRIGAIHQNLEFAPPPQEITLNRCLHCHIGTTTIVQILKPHRSRARQPLHAATYTIRQNSLAQAP